MKRYILLKHIIIFLLSINSLYLSAQTYIDTLKYSLSSSPEIIKKLEIIDKLSTQYLNDFFNLDSSLKYANKGLELSIKHKNKFYEGKALKNIGWALIYQQNYDSSLYFLNKSFDKISDLDSLKTKSEIYNLKGACYYYKGDFEKTLENWTKELKMNYRIGNKRIIATNLNNLGVIHKSMDQYEDAIYYYQESLKIEEERRDSSNIARALNNIGNIYFHNRGNYKKDLEYYTQDQNIYLKIKNESDYANVLINIGNVYEKQNKNQASLEYLKEALEIFKKLNDHEKIAETQNYIVTVYAKLGKFQLAIDYINKSFDYYAKTGAKPRIAETLEAQGSIYFEWGKYSLALDSYNESYTLFKQLGKKSSIADLYHKISDTYVKLNNYKKAFEYHTLATELNDSLFNEEVNRQIAEFQTKYETEKKDKEIALLNKDKALQESTLKRQKLAITFFIAGIVVISFFLALTLRLFRQKQKANKILEQKNEEISLQRDHIFQQNKEITDSIEYASRIQTALLPPQELINKIIPDSFILFKPRDIVSGDFYWLNQKENKIISVTADCTGHGVPGAFMSMLGISFLNEIVNISKAEDLRADVILNDMRSLIISSLRQTGNIGESRDGMDMTLCIIDYKKMELNFAGAYNPLYLIRNGELLETKGDKMPIGIHIKSVANFTNHIIPIQKGDAIYTFSDGYVDQFGGPGNNKFRRNNFRELLLKVHKKEMGKQKEILEKTLADWMKGYEQVDDILVSGIRI